MYYKHRLLSATLACLALASSAGASGLDTVQLSDAQSELAHAVTATDAPSGIGALGEGARWIDPGGSIYFDIGVDGTKQNYLTARFWGGVAGNQGRVFLSGSGGNLLNWGQLDDQSSSEIAPDRWYYATVPIPRSITDSQSVVRLSLSAMGNGNSLSNPPAINSQVVATRAIYTLFSHTDTRLAITDGVAQNPIVAPYDYGDYVQPSPIGKLIEHNRLVSLANNLAFQVANRQVLNPGAAGLPDSLLGAFDIRTGGSSDPLDILNATHKYHINTDNLGPLRGATILAHAYTMAGTSFYQDATTLSNIALGIDYTRRAQGSTGGYVDVWNPVEWVGGYNGSPRSVGTGSLEGITHTPISNAFLMTYQDMETAGLLDQLIDDDNNTGTPQVTRRQAYTDLFKGFIDFHTGYFSDNTIQEPGHAPNQEVYQLRGLMAAYQALELLDPNAVDEAVFAPIVVARTYQAFGFTNSYFNGTPWFSPKGLPLESGGLLGGGFSSEYGHAVSGEMFPIIDALAGLATPQQLAELTAQATKTASLWQNFLYPVYNDDGTMDLRLEGAINWRNSKINGLQGLTQDPWFVAALEQSDPGAIRILQLLQMDGRLSIDTIDNGHFWQQGVWMMEQVARIDQILENLPDTSFRLPHEAGQPDYAWIDPVGGAVSVKLGDRSIFMAMNWHHGSSGGVPVSNDIARIHEITPTEDRVLTIEMENPFGFGALSYLTYGELLIAANADDAQSYLLDVPVGFSSIYDLVSGQYLQLTDGQLTLAPGESVALNLTMGLTAIDGDLNGDGFVGIADLNVVLGAWNQTVPPGDPLADPTGDGFVGIADLNIVLGNWNAGTPPVDQAAIPEPAVLTLLSLGVPALLCRNRS